MDSVQLPNIADLDAVPPSPPPPLVCPNPVHSGGGRAGTRAEESSCAAFCGSAPNAEGVMYPVCGNGHRMHMSCIIALLRAANPDAGRDAVCPQCRDPFLGTLSRAIHQNPGDEDDDDDDGLPMPIGGGDMSDDTDDDDDDDDDIHPRLRPRRGGRVLTPPPETVASNLRRMLRLIAGNPEGGNLENAFRRGRFPAGHPVAASGLVTNETERAQRTAASGTVVTNYIFITGDRNEVNAVRVNRSSSGSRVRSGICPIL